MNENKLVESSGQAPYIDSKLLYEVLKAKNVANFHHANTVKTSLSFIANDALLSRGYVEQYDLIQTPQYTDDKDKKLGIWDSVFLDGLDLHKKYATRNRYGPVLFHIALDILLQAEFSKVRVTKSNPESWQSVDGNFYDNIEDIEKNYLTGDKLRDGRIMFLFDSPEKGISISKYCQKIVVDDPRIYFEYPDSGKKTIAEMVKGTIETALSEASVKDKPVEIRHPLLEGCNCYFQYKKMYEHSKEAFDLLFSKK